MSTESPPRCSPRYCTSIPSAGHSRRRRIRRCRRTGSGACAHREPDVRGLGPRCLAQKLRHSGRDVLVRVRRTEAAGELREHLVGRRSLAIDETVGHPPRQPPQRAEHGADDDADHEQAPFPGRHRSDRRQRENEQDRERQDREPGGDQQEHHGLLDHDVQVVQAVLQHRDDDRHREQEYPDEQQEEARTLEFRSD